MKYRFLFILLLFTYCLLTTTTSSATAHGIKGWITSKHHLNNNIRADTIKKVVVVTKITLPKVAPPKITPPKVTPPKLGLLAKLANALKFRRNFRAKEKQRIIDIIDSMVINNDKLATSQNITDLKQQLTDQSSKQYAELLKLIQTLQNEMPVVTPVNPADSAAQEQKKLDVLISKIVPILKSVTNTQSLNIDRQKRVQQIRDLYGRPENQTDTLSINDTTALVYKLRLLHNARVIGIENNPPPGAYLNYNFRALTAVQLYRYELNTADGYCRAIMNENSTALVKEAKKAGSSVYLSIYPNNEKISAFLSNTSAQAVFNKNILKYLNEQSSTGLNITFGGLDAAGGRNFYVFVKNLTAALSAGGTHYSLSITLPVGNASAAYDLKALNEFTDYFIIDYSKAKISKPGPVVPLSGKNTDNLQLTVSRFLNTGVVSKKFLVCFPYRGINWSYAKEGQKGVNPQYIPYRTIRTSYSNFFYNADTSVAYATKTGSNSAIDTVWYDDENTLAKKYDYVLLNKLGGIAFWQMGDDDGFGELWDVITDKFVKIDTVKVSLLHIDKNITKLTWGQKLKVYYELFEYPCDVAFRPDILKILNIDVNDQKANIAEFNKISKQLMQFFLIVNIVLGLLCTALIVITIYYLRIEGEAWPYRKLALGATTVLVMLFILTLSCSVFLNDDLFWFGASNGGDCINIPFHKLILIITFGVVIGMLLMRFLILPFIKRQDIP